MFSRQVIMVCAVVGALHACKTRSEESPSDLRFAMGDVKYSLLKDIKEKKGRISVCIALIGFPKEETSQAATRFQEMLTRAGNAWNALLKEHPNWPVKHDLDFAYSVQASKCQSNWSGFNVIVWRDADTFQKEHCSNPGYVCASGGSAITRTIYIGPMNRGSTDDIYEYFTVLHEYGHVLGLGDTYRNKGMSDWAVDQPPSVMNGQNYPPEVFTTDDRWGIWATLNALDSGKRDCAGYGKEVQMKLNAWQNVMCDPRTEATYVHRSLKEIGEILERREGGSIAATPSPAESGKWQYNGIDVNKTWMVVSSVDGQKDSFRTIGFVNGVSQSENGTTYKCERPLDVPFPRECVATSDENYKITLMGRHRLILKNPSIPDGVELQWIKSAVDWRL